jgi:hypothetical protein
MDLLQVKHYLRERRIVPLQDVALHFRVDVETVKPLLELWVGKGKVKKHAGADAGTCKGCCKCDPATLETYEWTG